MSIWEALILGIIQGLTEFLPVSSSGHLELGSVILGTENNDNLLFSIIVHGATSLSTIVVFRKEIGRLLADLFSFKKGESLNYSLKLIISAVPVLIVALLFKDQLEMLFTGRVGLVGAMLLVTAALLFYSAKKKNQSGKITFGNAIIIGIAQAIAVLPGISRSGSTIATALIIGVEKEKATRFSFLMVLIPILGATGLEFVEFLTETTVSQQTSSVALITGFLAAFISGLAACTWMIALVRRGNLFYFGFYCLVVGLVAIAWTVFT